jgi:hypothetical protein
MSSAIEVLKDKLEDARYFTCMDNPEEEDEDILAFKEAIVALEQKEKLKEWLDNKEAKLKDIKEKGWSLEQLAGKQILINEIRKELEEEGVEK